MYALEWTWCFWLRIKFQKRPEHKSMQFSQSWMLWSLKNQIYIVCMCRFKTFIPIIEWLNYHILKKTCPSLKHMEKGKWERRIISTHRKYTKNNITKNVKSEIQRLDNRGSLLQANIKFSAKPSNTVFENQCHGSSTMSHSRKTIM